MDCSNAHTKSDKILRKAVEAAEKLVPSKSSDRYKKEFCFSCAWRRENIAEKITEDVVLMYLLHMSKKLSSSSMWAKYSIIKSMLIVDISRFIKVVTTFGIADKCRRKERHIMSVNDVQDAGSQLLVTIPQTKIIQKRVFTVINEVNEINFLELFRKYISWKPKQLQCNKLFIRYRNGKCVCNRVGTHLTGAMPKRIAEFLNLENPENYTRHCFCRTSAILLANAGAVLTILKRHKKWRSTAIAERYIEDSMLRKHKIAGLIQGGESFVEVLQVVNLKISTTISTENSKKIPTITVRENTNCTININVNIAVPKC